jgi:hypothetical protein
VAVVEVRFKLLAAHRVVLVVAVVVLALQVMEQVGLELAVRETLVAKVNTLVAVRMMSLAEAEVVLALLVKLELTRLAHQVMKSAEMAALVYNLP